LTQVQTRHYIMSLWVVPEGC